MSKNAKVITLYSLTMPVNDFFTWGIRADDECFFALMAAVANLLEHVIPMGISIKDFMVIFYMFYEMFYIITHVSISRLPVLQFVEDALELPKNKMKK